MPPQIVSSEESPATVACDAIVVGATGGPEGVSLAGPAEELDSALDGFLGEYLTDIGFRAQEGNIEIVPTARRIPSKSVAVIGLGSGAPPSPDALRRAAGTAARNLAERSVVASALHVGARGDAAVRAAAEGFLLGAYRFTHHKSDGRPAKLQTVLFLGGPDTAPIESARTRAEATTLARDLTNEPPSLLTPEGLVRRSREVADVGGLQCAVLEEDELEARGFGGILAVGRGSSNPPRLLTLRYAPEGARSKVALVGKGITFDSGGLSMKDARSMETMKTDMAGAAAVIGALSALPRLDLPVEVTAYVPTCENMPGGRALKPGDVITHYGGRTTEVNNTDAEGRLVLADAVAYASEREPAAIVDVATLTGGVVVALGQTSTGLFSNDDRLAAELEVAAGRAGERLWRLPLYDDLKAKLDSDVADMKNSGGRFGSAIIGAVFIQQFVPEGIAWAHLDIAGTARAESDSGDVTKGGTGVATRTLLSWLDARAG